MSIEESGLTTWDSLHKEHVEIFLKVNLLEKALIDFLQKRVAKRSKSDSDQPTEFLEAFEHGIVLHFSVEEEALFELGENCVLKRSIYS